MAHKLYENFVLETQLSDLLNTKLNTRSLMKIDTDLAEGAGMIKKINRYTYDGKVEELGMGEGNTERGAVSFTTEQYEVGVSQQAFDYFDEEFMTDAKVLDMGLEGSATVMVNDINTKYFAELAKATLKHEIPAGEKITYDHIVDAIALMNVEDESGLFLIIGNDLKADVRKDADFKSARAGEILFNGQIGNICGVPVLVSKLVKEKAYLATKEAVTLFVKKESEIEQERDANKRQNSVYMRKVNLVAFTDATKAVEISYAPAVRRVAAAK